MTNHIRVIGVPRKPVDVAGLLSVLIDLAVEVSQQSGDAAKREEVKPEATVAGGAR